MSGMFGPTFLHNLRLVRISSRSTCNGMRVREWSSNVASLSSMVYTEKNFLACSKLSLRTPGQVHRSLSGSSRDKKTNLFINRSNFIQYRSNSGNVSANKSKTGVNANGSNQTENTGKMVNFTFVEAKSGDKINVSAPVGKTVLDVALDHDVDIEGACGGELACSTCHVILSKELFDSLPPKKEEEDDMLDLAWGLTDTSRLCCQIKVTEALEGAEFIVPSETNNML